MPIRGILFDSDQTLSDTIQSIYDRVCYVCRRAGAAPPTFEKFTTDFFMPFGEFLYTLGIDRQISLEQIWAWLDGSFRYDLIKPFPGIPEMIKDLFNQGIKLGVISAAPEDETRKRLVCAEIKLNHFCLIAGGKEDKVQAIIDFCNQSGLNLNEVAFVGDYINDMTCAKKAGVALRVGVVGPYSTADELFVAGAQVVAPEHLSLGTLLRAIVGI